MLDFPRCKVWAVSLLILAGMALAIPSLVPKSQVESWGKMVKAVGFSN